MQLLAYQYVGGLYQNGLTFAYFRSIIVIEHLLEPIIQKEGVDAMRNGILKRCLSLLLAFLLMLPLVSSFLPVRAEERVAGELSQGQINIVKRAKQMTSIQWTPLKDIAGWAGGLTYQAGVTYTGLPYGQPVDADYVPWETSLVGFLDAVNDPNSKMYTSNATYNEIAPYYSIDCSAFVSWAWDLGSRKDTRGIPNYATVVSTSSYENAQVGDCFNKSGTHVVLITDVDYDSSGAIVSIEISESTVNAATNYCCQVVRYGEGGAYSLDTLKTKYFDNGYTLYRSKTRDSVTYTHSCAAPLEGDVCSVCQTQGGAESGTQTAFGIDVSHHQGTIDWDAVKPQIDFAIIRCGYGDDLTDQDDKQWVRNADACTRLGIPFGVYLYSYALTDAQARSEVEHVLRLIEGYDLSLPIYLDLEDDSILNNCSRDDILRHTRIFCDIIEDAGYSAGVYANYNWWTSYLTSSEYDQWDRWIARYASSTGYNKEYTIWQFTSSGSINGISGNVDLNYWYGTFPPAVHEHSYSSYISQEPTCEQDGTRIYTCTCGDSYSEPIPATGHCYECTVTPPNCTDYGFSTYTCSVCGEYYQNDWTDPLGHHYVGSTTLPTCTEPGFTTYTCTACADTYKTEYTEPLGHDYSGGSCSRCGQDDPSAVTGDLTGDGAVTSADSVMLARYLADLVTLTDAQLTAADVNGDGSVSSADAVMLARYLVGVITELG